MYKAPDQYLAADAAASRLIAHAQLLLRLTRRFDAVAPGALRDAAHIANYKAGNVVIHADNGAIAAKLRQMSRRLCSELSCEGVECSDIEVKVQPRQIPERTTPASVKPISTKSMEILRSTAETLPEGALRAALGQLLARAATRE